MKAIYTQKDVKESRQNVLLNYAKSVAYISSSLGCSSTDEEENVDKKERLSGYLGVGFATLFDCMENATPEKASEEQKRALKEYMFFCKETYRCNPSPSAFEVAYLKNVENDFRINKEHYWPNDTLDTRTAAEVLYKYATCMGPAYNDFSIENITNKFYISLLKQALNVFCYVLPIFIDGSDEDKWYVFSALYYITEDIKVEIPPEIGPDGSFLRLIVEKTNEEENNEKNKHRLV